MSGCRRSSPVWRRGPRTTTSGRQSGRPYTRRSWCHTGRRSAEVTASAPSAASSRMRLMTVQWDPSVEMCRYWTKKSPWRISLLGIRKRPILAEIDYDPVVYIRIIEFISWLKIYNRMNRYNNIEFKLYVRKSVDAFRFVMLYCIVV